MPPVRSTRRSPLTPVASNFAVSLKNIKEEKVTPQPDKRKRRKGGEESLSTPTNNENNPGVVSQFAASPPMFSMDALHEVMGGCFVDASDGDETQFSLGMEMDVEQKFRLDDISTIEKNADTVATALFNASQKMDFRAPANPSEQTGYSNVSYQEESGSGSNVAFSGLAPTSSSLLPQLEHPIWENLFSPLTSPIYTRVVEDKRSTRGGKNEDEASTATNVGSEGGSDSDFQLDGDSSSGSDDSSDSDFNLDDSDSEFGGRKRRAPVKKWTRNPNRVTGGGAAGGRKQPYHHYKSAKSKEQGGLGGEKPTVRQINPQQLEAIAATMGSSPVTVNWLLQNYETSEGNSLPRALMYGHYLRHCAELRLDPVNAASFGKLIRSVFVGLTTRRLGTRGNSKYHYCGIRIKDTSALLLEDPDLSKKTRTNGKRSKKQQILAMQGVGICGLGGNKELTLDVDSKGRIEYKSVKKYLGSKSPSFPAIELDGFPCPEGLSKPDIVYFSEVYKKHCWQMMESLELFKLTNIEIVWKQFWQQGLCESSNSIVGIPEDLLLAITKIPDVHYAIQHWDAFTYDQMLTILLPNVIAQVPFQLLEEYHKFAQSLKSWLSSSLNKYSLDFVQLKLQLLDSFIDELKSWVSLNLSAQAARDSMQSPSSIAQLLSDLNRVNFRSVLMDVKEYVNVKEMDINVHESLKRILSGPDSIEPWSVWLVGLVEQRLGMSSQVRAAPDGASTLSAVVKECQDLSLRWLKYMSQLKLELLLRSSGSLATFLSLELLFSNFLLHLIKVYKSRALQVPLVLYSITRKSQGQGRPPLPLPVECLPRSGNAESEMHSNHPEKPDNNTERNGSSFFTAKIKPDPDGPASTSSNKNVDVPTLLTIKQEIIDE